MGSDKDYGIVLCDQIPMLWLLVCDHMIYDQNYVMWSNTNALTIIVWLHNICDIVNSDKHETMLCDHITMNKLCYMSTSHNISDMVGSDMHGTVIIIFTLTHIKLGGNDHIKYIRPSNGM